MMKLVSDTRLEVFAALTVHLGGFYRETGTTRPTCARPCGPGGNGPRR